MITFIADEVRRALEIINWRYPIFGPIGSEYIRLADLPEEYHAPFQEFMRGGQMPVIEGEKDCFYLRDWRAFEARQVR